MCDVHKFLVLTEAAKRDKASPIISQICKSMKYARDRGEASVTISKYGFRDYDMSTRVWHYFTAKGFKVRDEIFCPADYLRISWEAWEIDRAQNNNDSGQTERSRSMKGLIGAFAGLASAVLLVLAQAFQPPWDTISNVIALLLLATCIGLIVCALGYLPDDTNVGSLPPGGIGGRGLWG